MVWEIQAQNIGMVGISVPIAELLWCCEKAKTVNFTDVQTIQNVGTQNQNDFRFEYFIIGAHNDSHNRQRN